MKNIILNVNEQKKYDIIEKVVLGNITRKEAQYELNLSRQQIYRLINIFNTEGKSGFCHKNRGKNNITKKERNLIEELKQLYFNEYYDYNFIAFYDELNENKKYKGKYDISYLPLYREFLNDDIISPLAHKGTIKLYKEKMNNSIKSTVENIPEEKIELFESRQISFRTDFHRASHLKMEH